jgi:hypothetical protein
LEWAKEESDKALEEKLFQEKVKKTKKIEEITELRKKASSM